jgi:predicted ATPase
MTQGVNDMVDAGWKTWIAYCTGLLAHGLTLAGRAEDGLVRLEEAMAQEHTLGGLDKESEVHRLLGEVLSTQPDRSRLKAESAFRKAIDIARHREARSWELKATTSLAHLLHDTGRSDEARELLSEIYDWFTEGHELPYLMEAKSLLGELESI